MCQHERHSALLSTFLPNSRAPQAPSGEHAPFQNLTHITPRCHVVSKRYSQPSSCSPTGSSPVSPQRSNRRRRRTSGSPSSHTDPIIGQVTLAGKFKCLNEACLDDSDDLTFNRHADFKRHHDNIHARRSIEYFCPESGCARSRNPVGGKKGRGFRGRKDKMNEHHKAVHHKEGKKRKKSEEDDDSIEDQGCDDGGGSRKLKATRTSAVS
ncbi:hypothetical protein BKA58DRAFT_69045 [Alternaria rosae]|uniref:uncharacterized protein n=1 Tax=Alternaria rosae TaxID=1187941 RepID=UPI001E8DE679|nr:uncharacterized protein BKA58DRAFT_69045 [Alternaria rosae]KAH6851458.1 hypothetical protein BKA58DRAFT_69045 [Alternaria rosae]